MSDETLTAKIHLVADLPGIQQVLRLLDDLHS